MKNFVVICPIYNEELNITKFIARFEKVFSQEKEINFSILFSDNASTDKSKEIILRISSKNNKIKYIRYNKNYGVMKSIFTAITNLKSDGCAIFDCDLQDPPELLLKFIKYWNDGYKIVYGKRIKRKESFAMTFSRNIFKKITGGFRGYDIEVESGAFLLDKEAIKAIKKIDYDPFLPALIERLGLSKIGVNYNRVERKYGLSKLNFFGYLNYALDGLVSGTIQPLRISIFFCFFFFYNFFYFSFIFCYC